MAHSLFPVAAACALATAAHLWPLPDAAAARAGVVLPPAKSTRVHVNIPVQSLATKVCLATQIVHGAVTSVATSVAESGIVQTKYSIAVRERLTGTGGNDVEVIVAGGEFGDQRTIVGAAPRLSVGDEAVFFLWQSPSQSHAGLLGLGAGVFPVGGGATSGKVVGNVDDAALADLQAFKARIRELAPAAVVGAEGGR